MLALPAAQAADAPAAKAPPPAEAFARLPLFSQLTLSPDGKRYAAVVARDKQNQSALIISTLDGSEPTRMPFSTDNREARFAWLRWASNDRLVVSAAYPNRRGAFESTETRMFSLDRNGANMVELVARRPVESSRYVPQFQDQVIDWMPDDGKHILLAMDDTRVAEPSVYRVNIETGRRERVHRAQEGVRRWLTDRSHRVRVGIHRDEARIEVRVCDPDGQNWRSVWSYDVLSGNEVHPLGFGPDPQKLYLLANHNGRQSVQLADLSTPTAERRVLLSDTHFDLGGALISMPGSGEVVGIRHSRLGDSPASFWHEETRGLVRAIDQALPDRFNVLLQFTGDGQRYLLRTGGNGMPPQYLVGLRDRGQLALLAETYPELAGHTLPKKEPLPLRARDGHALPSYLTLPPGHAPKNLPTVVLPHGGPISRDTIEFDPLVQFLASRGYAVLQVNFRGSAGYGVEHRQAGLKRWGLEMQDDLSDALKQMIDRGAVDPRRVCIAGANYGGYAALMGGAKTPELYRCVFSYAGVSDLFDLAHHARSIVDGKATFERMIGSSWDDTERFKATSPARLAERFQVPVLLMHGDADRTVPVDQSETMAKALRRADKPVELVILEDGDHALLYPAHRLQVFKALEAFLARHIGTARME